MLFYVVEHGGSHKTPKRRLAIYGRHSCGEWHYARHGFLPLINPLTFKGFTRKQALDACAPYMTAKFAMTRSIFTIIVIMMRNWHYNKYSAKNAYDN